jgi:hypothetical protein
LNYEEPPQFDTKKKEANNLLKNEYCFCEISSSHGSEYEAQNLLGCTASIIRAMSELLP